MSDISGRQVPLQNWEPLEMHLASLECCSQGLRPFSPLCRQTPHLSGDGRAISHHWQFCSTDPKGEALGGSCRGALNSPQHDRVFIQVPFNSHTCPKRREQSCHVKARRKPTLSPSCGGPPIYLWMARGREQEHALSHLVSRRSLQCHPTPYP